VRVCLQPERGEVTHVQFIPWVRERSHRREQQF
jgi:hypothetical protein